MASAARAAAILEAATSVFARLGPQLATLDAIAAEAGVHKTAVYKHHESKEALFEAAVTHERQVLIDWVIRAYDTAAEGTARERTRARYRAIFDYAAARPDGFTLLLEADGAHRSSGEGETRDRLTDHLARTLRRDLAPYAEVHATADVLAAMFTGMAEATARRFAQGSAWETERIVEILTEFTMAGMTTSDPVTLLALERPPP